MNGIQLQYGSFPILRGSVSENISCDEDGWVSGERLPIKRPKQLFFDDISVTYAYIGDYYKPNMFRRLDRFSQSNYHQFLVSKNLVHEFLFLPTLLIMAGARRYALAV